MKESIVVTKSFDFAIRIVNLYKFLLEMKREYVMSKQILRCVTSIGANVRESQSAESKPDFIHKLSVALKEVDETSYWLELLYKTEFITNEQYESLIFDTLELRKIISSIILTSRGTHNS
ncbi:MAG: four helix bundle protein [Bacteroidetes bacterium]|nr:four helix bundle protein [Bacteroidota bacterium]